MKEYHQCYLERYLQTVAKDKPSDSNQVVAEYFCADEYNANTCAQLVLQGTKTATCSLYEAYALDKEELPECGRLTVVLNWDEEPVCIIETTEVTYLPFNQISPEFAYEEGEGDRSYAHWRKSHIEFFQSVCDELGLTWHEEQLIVCERFKRVYG